MNPTFPDSAEMNPFALGVVWGIDRGWATSITGYGMRMKLPSGRYHVDVSVAPLYADLFAVTPSDGFTSVTLDVHDRGHHRDRIARSAHTPDRRAASPGPRVPIDEDPDPRRCRT